MARWLVEAKTHNSSSDLELVGVGDPTLISVGILAAVLQFLVFLD